MADGSGLVHGHRDSVCPALDLKQQESSCRDMLQVQRWVPTLDSSIFFQPVMAIADANTMHTT